MFYRTVLCPVCSVEILQYRVFKGRENGLVSVFSMLAKIQKFIILHCPNFAQHFSLQLLLEKSAASLYWWSIT